MRNSAIMQAETAARAVLHDHGVESAPINVVRLAKGLGYDVYRASFTDERISGGVEFLGDSDKKGNIYINREDSVNRQRFTIAHEIGHCVLHRSKYESNGLLEGIDMLRNPNDHSEEEAQANAFAAELLMPKHLVKQTWDTWGSTEILADIFKVSIAAMSYRLFNLGLKGDW